jgi:hypothetical protein
MIKIRATLVLTFLMAIGSASTFLSSCKDNSNDGKIIITRATSDQQKSYNIGDSSAYILQSQIVSIDPQKPENSLKILSISCCFQGNKNKATPGRYGKWILKTINQDL